MNTARRVTYTGRVQGVGFRYSVKQIAAGYEVTGWVRNLPDGRVEMFAAGDVAEVTSFVAAVAGSHLAGYIRAVDQEESAEDLSVGQGFVIRR